MPPKEWLSFLREQFPEGTRIRLREAKQSCTSLKSGSTGTLDSIVCVAKGGELTWQKSE